ncbi:methylmalonyl-CoA epimerase [Mesonia mobilis]|uniref:Methylmalonyl-CoA epimerase n=1 Tax=Mesonia mobilis TaxID=369791 RepID=A0ABQ3BX81_9FLAO|nr:methylmalonyl-CoA epimerase [Mesonia mobilis]MBQ0739055.1 methylmalonyl-CoA epimerase [Aquimarina celericrescens]GGZ59853.1 methylmalonyl-CoA epimerase [Mesonia mobilis]
MKKIEHIGIAVKNLAEANQLYSTLLNTKPYKEEAVESEGVTTSFFEVGESKIELLAATREDSAIAKYIEKRGEGIHHIAFYVDNIEDEIERLQQEGFKLLNDQPKRGADQKKIAFLHPKSAQGVLVELCEDINK